MRKKRQHDLLVIVTRNTIFAYEPTPLTLVNDKHLAIVLSNCTDRFHHALAL